MIFQPRRYWPILFAVILFVMTGFLWLLSITGFNVLNDIFFDRYDGRKFIYWSVRYYQEFSIHSPLVLLSGFLILSAIRMSHRLFKYPEIINPYFRLAFNAIRIGNLINIVVWFFLVLFTVHPLRSTHLLSVQVENSTYHFDEISPVNYATYTLYNCDQLGLQCSVAKLSDNHYFALSDYLKQVGFNIDPLSYQFDFVVNGETIYSATPSP